MLKGSELHYFDSDSDKTANGVVDLTQAKEIAELDSDGPTTFRIVLPQRTYFLRAPDESELADWLACLHEATVRGSRRSFRRRVGR